MRQVLQCTIVIFFFCLGHPYPATARIAFSTSVSFIIAFGTGCRFTIITSVVQISLTILLLCVTSLFMIRF
ncbi:uncharacterized protein BX664DRAFT_342977, partial [Halteromyces radiatus]|uniref:uncharacterized protein n=1 Tax=Halteromyces radiatus TaxID=101107 RepID=UPI0022200DDB